MRLTLHATFVRCVFTAVFMSLFVGSFSMGATPTKLNVLLLMADDLRDFGGAFTDELSSRLKTLPLLRP